jgi:hypothetical protein
VRAKRYIYKLWVIVFGITCFCFPSIAKGYALLTHEMIVDATWDKSILPLLKQKYPAATTEELKEARAYVYGGTVIPDIGYYPFGNMLFTNLVHYVRTGDFIQALLDESQNLDEYAFAVGVLCHYTADIYGHSIGTNRAVPLRFPKVKAKYGSVVTYEEDHVRHIQMEFSFDVLQTALGDYTAQSYQNFIDFKISQPVLERAFYKTYSLDLKNYFNPTSIAFLRYSIKHIYEELTEDAWKLKKTDITKDRPLLTEKDFRYRMGKRDYYKEYGKPKFKAIFFYSIVKILPKIGPLLILRFEVPSPEVEKLYKQSLDTVIYRFSFALKQMCSGECTVKNMDYDTGDKTLPGEYSIADESYFNLLWALKNNQFKSISPKLKKNILDFYTNTAIIKFPKNNSRKWEKLSSALVQLKTVEVVKN